MLGKRFSFWFALLTALLIISASILFIRWSIGGFLSKFKDSPEVFGAVINAIASTVTVGFTLGVTIVFNLKTQQLTMKQLEINEQQTRISLRDLVYQKRVEFYLDIISKINKIRETGLELLRLKEDKEYKKFIDLLDELEEFIDKNQGIASKKLRESFALYSLHKIFLDKSNIVNDINLLKEILLIMEAIIDLELHIDKIDNDIYSLIDRSKIEGIELRLMEMHKKMGTDEIKEYITS